MERVYSVRVNLEELCQSIMSFFREKGFITSIQGTQLSRKIVAAPRFYNKVQYVIEVNVKLTEDHLVVNVETFPVHHSLGIFNSLLWLFGGGPLILRALKSDEKLDEVLRDFWLFIERKMRNIGC